MTTLQPPPERELPPGRHASMRADVLRGIAGRPARRRYLAPLASAAAVVLVVGGAVLWTHQRDDVPDRGLVATQPTVPGFDEDELTALRKGCIDAVRANDTKDQYFDLDEAVLHNALATKRGPIVLLYADGGELNCGYVRSASSTNPPGLFAESVTVNDNSPRWLPGAASIDYEASNTDAVGGWRQLGGRVPAGVARVEVTLGDNRASVDAANGTYLVEITLTTAVESSTRPVVRTFDANGVLLGSYTTHWGEKDHCVATPDGDQIEGNPRKDLSQCEEAVPWR